MPQPSSIAVVLDTSFLIDYSAGCYWTLTPYDIVKRPDSRIIIPAEVGTEFDRLVQQKIDPNAKGGYQEIGRLLRLEKIGVYNDSLRQTLAEKLEEVPDNLGHAYKPLSRTDKTFVQAAIDFARQGTQVAAVSGDRGIVDQTDRLRDEMNLPITIYSPWRVPVRQGSIDLIVSGNVFGELEEAQRTATANSDVSYITVANNLHIGGKVRYDIAFSVYVNRHFALTLPRLDDGYFIKAFLVPKSFAPETYFLNHIGHYLSMLASKIFAVHIKEYPNQLALVKVENPLTLLEKQKLLDALRGKLKRIRLDRKYIDALDSPRLIELKWARMEDSDISRFDKVTVGRLKQDRFRIRNNH